MKRITALTLVLAILLSILTITPAMAAESHIARTTLAGGSDSKIENIRLAAAALDGITIAYGETFSFNDAVGPRTRARGYKAAPNGRGVDVIGGGVAQVATTLYLALRQINEGFILYDELTTYGSRFTDNYVADGNLAVITDYSGDLDFCFTNYSADALMLSFYILDNQLCCTVSPLNTGSWNMGTWSFTQNTNPNPNLHLPVASASLYTGGGLNLLTNITLAADSIYDTTLSGSDRFSFNDIVGPRTERYGFSAAINGRGVEVIGGGVAQVASVIWLAIKQMDDIVISEKATYGSRYNQTYVSSSADAILTDYNAGTDFSFSYTGSGSISIYTYLEGEYLFCDIYRNN